MTYRMAHITRRADSSNHIFRIRTPADVLNSRWNWEGAGFVSHTGKPHAATAVARMLGEL